MSDKYCDSESADKVVARMDVDPFGAMTDIRNCLLSYEGSEENFMMQIAAGIPKGEGFPQMKIEFDEKGHLKGWELVPEIVINGKQ